jgi:hypothetical protein
VVAVPYWVPTRVAPTGVVNVALMSALPAATFTEYAMYASQMYVADAARGSVRSGSSASVVVDDLDVLAGFTTVIGSIDVSKDPVIR